MGVVMTSGQVALTQPQHRMGVLAPAAEPLPAIGGSGEQVRCRVEVLVSPSEHRLSSHECVLVGENRAAGCLDSSDELSGDLGASDPDGAAHRMVNDR